MLAIIRDADMMDMFGAMGLIRGIAATASRPEYDPKNIKGDSWGASRKYFDDKMDGGLNTGKYILDDLNFHISCYGNINFEFKK